MTNETPVKVIVDLSKPKGQRESIIPLTEDEILERELQAEQAEAERLQQEQEQAALSAAKQAAQDKLKALGLTDLEIAALTGA